MIRNVLRHINNMSIRTKILVFSIAISVVPLMAVTTLNYYSIAGKTKESVTYSANQVFNQNRQLLENKINTVWSITVSIASDQDIIQYNLSDHPNEYYDDYVAQNKDYIKLSAYINGFSNYPEVQRAIVYSAGKHMFADENTSFFSLDKASGTQWYQRLMGRKDSLVWFPYSKSIVTQVGVPVVSAMRKIKDLNNYNQLLGILRIDLPLSQIAHIADTNVITPNTHAFILNSTDEIIYSKQSIMPSADLGIDYNVLKSQYKDIGRWYDVELKQGRYMLKCAPIGYTDWLMVMAIPNADLLASSYKTRDDMILVAIITSVVAGVLAYLISASLTRRIRMLASRMQAIDGNVSDALLMVDSQDELGKLQKAYNGMLSRIQSLMKEEHRLGQEVKSLELKALQAQINPHFLYNTLDLIHWRAMNKGVPEISKIVQALARFYKLGLSRGEETVLLANEIEHVRMYVQIQNERFSNLLRFKADVDATVADCKVLKLLLQPLVENAIIHGIMEKRMPDGTIAIRACSEGGLLKIAVEDDGNGMSDEKINDLLTTASSREHYGVKNINDRIKLLYGQEYGLQYKSRIGEGTVVTISLPIIK